MYRRSFQEYKLDTVGKGAEGLTIKRKQAIILVALFSLMFIGVTIAWLSDIMINWNCSDGYTFRKFTEMPCGNYTYIVCGAFSEQQGKEFIEYKWNSSTKWVQPIEWCPIIKQWTGR